MIYFINDQMAFAELLYQMIYYSNGYLIFLMAGAAHAILPYRYIVYALWSLAVGGAVATKDIVIYDIKFYQDAFVNILSLVGVIITKLCTYNDNTADDHIRLVLTIMMDVFIKSGILSRCHWCDGQMEILSSTVQSVVLIGMLEG